MDDNENFYKKFNSDPPKSVKTKKFTTTFLYPFLSGILGAVLVVGIVFGSTNISSLLSKASDSSDSSDSSSSSNTGVVDYVSLSNYSDTAVYAASKVLPSIVGITVEYTVTSSFSQSLSQVAEAEGSGIIMSSDGYILTNNHIISSSDSSVYYEVSEAVNVYVYLYDDDTPYEATIIGTDEETDLAVIKIDKDGLTAAELGDSDSVKVGEFVLAIGNPLGMESSVTSGIISAVNRTVTSSDGTTYNLIQTDAAINSGNSGGALVNSEGEVIGINTLKLSGTGIEGMGFAIPINDTIDVYNQLVANGKVARPYIGITGEDLDAVTAQRYSLPTGVYVDEVDSDGPAASSGLQAGDIITALDGEEVSSMDDLVELKNSKNIGDEVVLTVYRAGETLEITVTLGEEP